MTDSTQPIDPLVQQALNEVDKMEGEGQMTAFEAQLARVAAYDIPDLVKWRQEGRHFHMPAVGPYTDENPNICQTCGESLPA